MRKSVRRKSVRRKSVRRKSVRRNYIRKTRRRKSGRNKTTIKRNYKKNKNRNRRNRKVKTNNNYKFMKGGWGSGGWDQQREILCTYTGIDPVGGFNILPPQSNSPQSNSPQVTPPQNRYRLAILIPGELPRYADKIKIEYRKLKNQHDEGYTTSSRTTPVHFYHVSVLIEAINIDNPDDKLELRFMKSKPYLCYNDRSKFLEFKDLKTVLGELNEISGNNVNQAIEAYGDVILNKKDAVSCGPKTNKIAYTNLLDVMSICDRIKHLSSTYIEFKEKFTTAKRWSDNFTKGWQKLFNQNINVLPRDQKKKNTGGDPHLTRGAESIYLTVCTSYPFISFVYK